MPFKRKFTSARKSAFKRRRLSGLPKKRKSTLPVRNRKAINKLKSAVETKQTTIHLTSTSITTDQGSTGLRIEPFSTIARSTSTNGRVGSMIKVTSVELRLVMILNAVADALITTAQAFTNVRVVVVREKAPFSPLLGSTYDQIFETVSGNQYDALVALPAWFVRNRYKIVYDKLFKFSAMQVMDNTVEADQHYNVPSGQCIHYIKKSLKLGWKVKYNAEDDVEMNMFQLYLLGDNALGPLPTVRGWLRIKYKDM